MGSINGNGFSMDLKNAFDPVGLLHDGGSHNFRNQLGGFRAALDPFGANLTSNIMKHNNTQDNLRGYMDPGQLFGNNATTAPGPDPSLYQVKGGTGYDPSIAAPANGISTDGLVTGTATNGLLNGTSTSGLADRPDWATIIANALKKKQ